ncbi:response regulator [Sedimenticola hydrogenitrophicus]|uniref:response regulator n=1 Tax=Sedimenticola hydrogenitrophicus TaxID=2967975 RepID=UPI0023B0C60F|nr:response regulator transcription factor [Sedimenticola hydrogenitrophicus]
MTDQLVSVMLVDDQPIVRAGFRRLMGTDGTLRFCCEAADGEEACRLYKLERPDVVVMDLIMPGMGGLEAARRILVGDPVARILVFSVHDNEEMLARALKVGVLGYLTKKSAPAILLDAIGKVAQGHMYIDPELAGKAIRYGGGLIGRLTQREFEVFRLLAEGKTPGEIAALFCISPKTVSVHQTHIMQKLEVRSLVQLAHVALRHGIVRS